MENVVGVRGVDKQGRLGRALLPTQKIYTSAGQIVRYTTPCKKSTGTFVWLESTYKDCSTHTELCV